MPEETPNHGFQLWARGEKDWEHRSDFRKVDRRLELRGAVSDRPDDPPDGTKFLVTEGEEQGAVFVYRSSDSKWVKQPVDANELRAAELNDTVRMVGENDDLVDAIDSPGVYFVFGGHSPDAAINVPSNTRIYGFDAVVDRAGNSSEKVLKVDRRENVTVDGLELIGGEKCLRVASSSNVTVRNCTASGASQDGFYFMTFSGDAADGNLQRDCSLESCESYGNGRKGVSFENNVRFFGRGVRSHDNTGEISDGFHSEGDGAGNVLQSCYSWNNGRSGFFCTNETSVGGCVAERNSAWGFRVRGPVYGCEAYENDGDGFKVHGRPFVGNVARHNGNHGLNPSSNAELIAFNVASDNEMSGCQAGSDYSGALVVGNQFVNNGSRGYRELPDSKGADGNFVFFNRITGNKVDVSDIGPNTVMRGNVGVTRTQDLSTVAPNHDGEVRIDDGTNFAPGERAYADIEDGVWRAFSDPSGTTVSY